MADRATDGTNGKIREESEAIPNPWRKMYTWKLFIVQINGRLYI